MMAPGLRSFFGGCKGGPGAGQGDEGLGDAVIPLAPWIWGQQHPSSAQGTLGFTLPGNHPGRSWDRSWRVRGEEQGTLLLGPAVGAAGKGLEELGEQGRE